MYLQNRPTWCFDSAFSLAAQQIFMYTPVNELLLVHASEWSEAYLDTVKPALPTVIFQNYYALSYFVRGYY